MHQENQAVDIEHTEGRMAKYRIYS